MADFEGVNCDACHRMIDPMGANGQLPHLIAEADPDGISAEGVTFTRDWDAILQYITGFAGAPFYDGITQLPVQYGDGSWPNYVEATSGQYYVDPDSDKRGNRFDASPKSHNVLYSRFHKSKNMCATCHDVSNAALANALIELGLPEKQAAGSYFHVERTWSEFQLSAFAQAGGATTDPQYYDRTGVAHAASCQDCHMKDTVGKACNKNVPIRSDLAHHDLTGGNTWITGILASADVNGPAYDAYNYAILSGNKYPGAFIDVAGIQNHGAELLAGEVRARANLRNAADLEIVSDNTSQATLRIRNLTGHKLISGFPEGRRMWLRVDFYDANGGIISSLNSYEPLVTSTDTEGNRQYVSGGILNTTRDDLVYEAKMSSDLTGEEESFHFVLATERLKDNRIPPKGFDIASAPSRLAHPRWHGADAMDYFTAAEYAGGYDEVVIDKPLGTAAWKARLFYQTTSKEYIEFLRDEANGLNPTLSSPTPSGEPTAYIIQSDPYFATIKDWGTAMWDLWLNNGGSPPEIMAELTSEPIMGNCSFSTAASHIRFLTLPGRDYQVQYSGNMSEGNWIDLGEEIAGDGTVMEVIDTDPLLSGKRFYRVNSEEKSSL
jgi:hypothetical protein